MLNDTQIAITTECVCDLPLNIVKARNIDYIYFRIQLDNGIFMDTHEITAKNLIAYMEDHNRKAISITPGWEEYYALFQKKLKQYKEIIHISLSSNLSRAYSYAVYAKELLGEDSCRVHVIDSRQLSSGMGLLVLCAHYLTQQGYDSARIIQELNQYIPLIQTSFLVNEPDYMYYNKQISANSYWLIKTFDFHLNMKIIDGKIKLSKLDYHDYYYSLMYYIKNTLRHPEHIDKNIVFITHSGISWELLEIIKTEVLRLCPFKQVVIVQASATITSNSGPNTIGILYKKL